MLIPAGLGSRAEALMAASVPASALIDIRGALRVRVDRARVTINIVGRPRLGSVALVAWTGLAEAVGIDATGVTVAAR
jgi:hypothetical protein